jgi:serine/threonine-protein kinase
MRTCPTCETPSDEGVSHCPRDGTPLEASDPLLGSTLGERYRVRARLAAGGMGTVYRAEHVVLRKRVAVKVLRPELSLDADLVRRFQEEAIAASQIGQENIVDVTDFGRTPQGAVYFVMEELEGPTLADLVAAGPLSIPRAALILAQVCRALAAAHGRGIVHRDLKPDNVMVTTREDGSDFVKVLDFGIAKTGLAGPRSRVTRAGTIIGTPEYMAPEQGAAAAVDQRADVYAFGVLAYELLTGRVPFHAESPVATVLEHQTRPPVPPREHRPELPPRLEALVLRALAKRPEARQQDMAEVAVELSEVLRELGLPPVYDVARVATPRPAMAEPAPAAAPHAGDAPRTTSASGAPRAAVGRRTTGRGATLEMEPPASSRTGSRGRASAGAGTDGARGGRGVVVGVLAAAALVAIAAALAWAWTG